MEEFKFDGFRFDGVTSMMYKHHGLQVGATGNYDEYFGMATDVDAMVYWSYERYVAHQAAVRSRPSQKMSPVCPRCADRCRRWCRFRLSLTNGHRG